MLSPRGSGAGHRQSATSRRRRCRLLVVVAAVAGALALGACSGSGDDMRAVPSDGPVTTTEWSSARVAGLSPVALTVHDGVVWVADPAGAQVVALDATTSEVLSAVPASGYPSAVAAGGAGVFAAERLVGWVVELSVAGTPPDDTGAGSVSDTATVTQPWSTGGDFPDDLVVTDDAVWVANYAGRSLARIDVGGRGADAGAAGASGTAGEGPDLVVPLGLRPSSIGVLDDVVWATGTAANEVVRVGTDGAVLGATVVEGGPDQLAIGGADSGAAAVWVTTRVDGRLVRMDPDTSAVDGEVDLGFRPTALAIGTGGEVWVADGDGGRVVRVDAGSLEVTGVVATSGWPASLAVANDVLWVAEAGAASVTAVDLATGARRTSRFLADGPDVGGPDGVGLGEPLPDVVGLRPVPGGEAGSPDVVVAPSTAFAVGGNPFYAAFDGDTLWVTEFDPDEGAGDESALLRMDASTGEVTGRWPVDGQAGGVAVAEGVVWVATLGTGRLLGFDAAGGGPVHDIDLGGGADPLGVVAAFGSVWVAMLGAEGIAQVDPASAELVGVIAVGAQVANVAATDTLVWATLNAEGQAIGVDPATGEIVRRVDVGLTTTAIAVGAGRVWVTAREDGVVAAIDPEAGRVVGRTMVGNRPRGLAVQSGGPGAAGAAGEGLVWVAVSGDGAVVGLDASTGALRTVAPGGDFPLNVAAEADGGSVWATDNDGGAVVRIGPPR